jgi:hypothetical protein
MRSIVISQSAFEELQSSDFEFTVDETNREFQKEQYPIGIDDEGEIKYADHFYSFVTGEATAKHGELEIKFLWTAKGGDKTYSDAFDFTIDIDSISGVNFETNFMFIDEEGEEIEGWRLEAVLTEKLDGYEWVALVQDLLPIPEIEEIDINEDSDMNTFTVKIDNAPNLRFTGELVASVPCSDDFSRAYSHYNQRNRWTHLDLFKTKGGKFVCRKREYTCYQGERDRYSGKVCETLEEVKEFFGHGWLAEELYAKASIDDVVDVE